LSAGVPISSVTVKGERIDQGWCCRISLMPCRKVTCRSATLSPRRERRLSDGDMAGDRPSNVLRVPIPKLYATAHVGDGVVSKGTQKGCEVSKGDYIQLEPEELEAIGLESKRTIEIDEFVPKEEIDDLYIADPYYVVPDGDVGQQAFAVIREAIRKEGMVAIGKIVFTSREYIIALEPREKGMMGAALTSSL
jgi:hypothetical protein